MIKKGLSMSKIKIGRMVVGAVQTNCYFLHNADTNEVVVIDPGDKGKMIYQELTARGYKIKAVLLTHGHFDHIMGADDIRKSAGVLVYLGEHEEKLISDAQLNVSAMFGTPYTTKADVFVKDGEILELAGMKIKVLHTPGHTAGGVSYYLEEEGILICGDTLFLESVGRTDFPTSSAQELKTAIHEKLFTLPDDVYVYPGHGPTTTIGHEKENNPFV